MKLLRTFGVESLYVDGVMSDWFAVGSGVRQGYRIAPDLFLGPMDHMMERAVHRGMTGVTLGKEMFTDLDFADDVSLLSEMLEVLDLALSHAGRGFYFWSSDKLVENQNPTCPSSSSSSTVQVADHPRWTC